MELGRLDAFSVVICLRDAYISQKAIQLGENDIVSWEGCSSSVFLNFISKQLSQYKPGRVKMDAPGCRRDKFISNLHFGEIQPLSEIKTEGLPQELHNILELENTRLHGDQEILVLQLHFCRLGSIMTHSGDELMFPTP